MEIKNIDSSFYFKILTFHFTIYTNCFFSFPLLHLILDTFMQKTKKMYQNTRTQHNLDRLNSELNEVSQIMTKNLENVLWRGEGLEKMSNLSDQLRYESQKYKKSARDLNLQLLYRKYGPFAVIGFVVFVVIAWRWWY